MALSYYADRANLYRLLQLHPDWIHQQFAAVLGRSRGWGKKWRKRFFCAQVHEEPLSQTLQGHSRARQTPVPSTPALLIERILAIRDGPPEGLRRVPGPQAIAYYLQRDQELQAQHLSVPSERTIYRVLKEHDRLPQRPKRHHEPLERPVPMTNWQIDFKDVSSVPADPEGKQQHVVETLNVLDTGTSVLLAAQVRADFTAHTALQALASTLQTYGCPQRITLDRDPPWGGSPAGSDFPSALLRFGACLGIDIHVCDPHHPQQNAFVER